MHRRNERFAQAPLALPIQPDDQLHIERMGSGVIENHRGFLHFDMRARKAHEVAFPRIGTQKAHDITVHAACAQHVELARGQDAGVDPCRSVRLVQAQQACGGAEHIGDEISLQGSDPSRTDRKTARRKSPFALFGETFELAHEPSDIRLFGRFPSERRECAFEPIEASDRERNGKRRVDARRCVARIISRAARVVPHIQSCSLHPLCAPRSQGMMFSVNIAVAHGRRRHRHTAGLRHRDPLRIIACACLPESGHFDKSRRPPSQTTDDPEKDAADAALKLP